MTAPVAGFEPGCDDCRQAVREGLEACERHYVPTHHRSDPEECPTCGGRRSPGDDVCGRCQGAGVA